MNKHIKIKYFPYIVIAILLLVSISVFYTIEQRNTFQDNTFTYLTSVNTLRSKNISKWYQNEIQNTQHISQNTYLHDLIEAYLESPNQNNTTQLNSFISILKTEHSFDTLYFIDTSSLIHTQFSTIHTKHAYHAYESADIYISSIYRRKDSTQVLDFSIPVFSYTHDILGILVFQYNMYESIEHIINQKPFQNSSLKSYLLHKDSTQSYVSFDYQTRKKINIAQTMPSISDSLFQHIYVQKDPFYNYKTNINDSVLLSISHVPQTNWLVYSTLPIDIVYAQHYKTTLFIVILSTIVFLLFILIFAYFRIQRKQKVFKKLNLLEQEYQTLFYSIGDAIIVTNTKGEIQNLNSVAEHLINYKEKNIIQKHIDSVLHVIHNENNISHQEIIHNVLETGRKHTMFHATLFTNDGLTIPIYESIAPIRNKNNKISGLILVLHDQTEERSMHEALQESNRQLESLFTNLPGMFYRCKNVFNWDMEFVSKGSYELTGYTPDDFIKNKVSYGKLIHPDDKEYVYNTIQSSISHQKDFKIEYRIVTRNKTIKWLWEKGTVVYDKDGNIKSLEGYIEDITNYKQTQLSLKNSEEMYRKQFEDHSAIQFLINPENGQIVNINKAGIEYYGWEKEEFLTKRLDDINIVTYDEILEQVEDFINQSQKNYMESQHMQSDGSIRDVEVYSSPVIIQGKTYMHAIVHDITEKKQAENQILLQSHALEQSPVSIIITDNNGKIEYVNKKFCSISGYCLEEVIGKTPAILRSNSQNDEFYTSLWNRILSGKDWEGEFQNKKKDGSLYWEKAIISPITNKQGNISHFIAIKEDITEKKNLINELTIAKEKAEENDKLKSAFLANMSHEIRTPMNGIVGFSEFLKDPNLNFDMRKKYAHIIIESSKQLLHIVNDILDISRIESKTLNISHETCSMNDLCNEIYDFFAPSTQKKNIDFKLHTELPNNKAFINTDKSRIKQILTNLLSNAVKFTDSGYIIFGYTITENNLQFYVKDSGIGISEKDQQIIFKSFHQVRHSSEKEYGGTGLGLAISQEIATLMGGSLTVESELDKGSCFYLTIPYTPTDKPDNTITIHTKHPQSEKHKHIILVAEDDDTNFLYIQTVLSFNKNITIERAHNGKEAIDTALKNTAIKLIFMDVKMPKINGFEASKKILSENPDIPIIILSAFNLESEKKTALEIGCYDYIVKPIKKDKVTQILTKFLDVH
ncbi:MAG: PAS domain S-box protein [Bacteroidales bacterium]